MDKNQAVFWFFLNNLITFYKSDNKLIWHAQKSLIKIFHQKHLNAKSNLPRDRENLFTFRLFAHHKCWCALNTHMKHSFLFLSETNSSFVSRWWRLDDEVYYAKKKLFLFNIKNKAFHEFWDWKNWRRECWWINLAS